MDVVGLLVIILGGMVIYSILLCFSVSNIPGRWARVKSTWSNKEANAAATFNRKHGAIIGIPVRGSVRLHLITAMFTLIIFTGESEVDILVFILLWFIYAVIAAVLLTILVLSERQ